VKHGKVRGFAFHFEEVVFKNTIWVGVSSSSFTRKQQPKHARRGCGGPAGCPWA